MAAHGATAAPEAIEPQSGTSATTSRGRTRVRVSSTEAIKASVFAVGRMSGLFSVVRNSAWRSSRLLILCYHGLSQKDEHEALRDLFVPAGLFRERMLALRKGGYNVLRLGEAVERLHAGTLPRRSVVLTFDDGFVDFSRVACPILAEFGFPATVYVSTEYVENQLPAFPAILTYLLWKAGVKNPVEPSSIDGIPLRVESRAAQTETAQQLMAKLDAERVFDPPSRDAFAARVAHQLGVDYDSIREERLFQLMTHEELRALDRKLVDVQLHTHRHRQPADEKLFAREIEDNRSSLANAGIDPAQLDHFCYPNGEVRAELPAWLEHQGVRSATTCVPGIVDNTCSQLLMPRFVDTQLVSPMKFEAWLCGAAALLPSRSR